MAQPQPSNTTGTGWIPVWSATDAYTAGEFVQMPDTTTVYIASQNIAAGIQPGSNTTGVTGWVPKWESGKTYTVGEYVYYLDSMTYFYAYANILPLSTTVPDTTVSNLKSWVPIWTAGVALNIGNYVWYNGSPYMSLHNFTAETNTQDPASYPQSWRLITGNAQSLDIYSTLYSDARLLEIAYKQGTAAADQVYPEADTYDILGQLYAPRIYGKNLTAFELASSGIIALTLQDVHALDIDRDAPSSNVILRTVANDGLLLSLTNCNVGSILLGNDSNVTILAGNNAAITASNDMALTAVNDMYLTASNVNITGCNIDINSGDSLAFSAPDLSLYGSNQATIQSGSNLLSFTPTGGLLQTVDGPLNVSACNDLSIYTTIMSVDASSNITLVSDCNVTMQAGSNVIAVTPDTATVQSGDNLLSMSPQQATLQAGSNLFITSGATITMAASNDLFLQSSGDASLSAVNVSLNADSNITTTAATVGTDASTLFYVNAGDINMGASNAVIIDGSSITLTGSATASLQSGSNLLAFTPTTALIQSVDNPLQFSACNGLIIDAQVFDLIASSNVSIVSACNMTFTADGGSLLFTPSNVMLQSDSNLLVTSGSNMTIYSGNDLTLSAASNIVIKASNLSLPLANFNMDSSGNMTLRAAETLTMVGGSQLALKSGSNEISLTPSNLDIMCVNGDMQFSACNDMITTIGSDYAITAGDTISFAASNGIVFHSDSNMSMSALGSLTGTGDSQVLFWSASNKLELDPQSATLSAGDLSSIDVSNTGIAVMTPDYLVSASTSFQVSAPAVSIMGSNISLDAVTSAVITASNVQLQSSSGDQAITLDDSTGILLDSSKRVELVASDLTGAAGSVVVDGNTHSVTLSSLTADSNIMSYIELADSNITGVAAQSQRFYVGTSATGTPVMELDSTGVNAFGAQHNFFVTATDTPAVSVYRDAEGEAVLRVRGRLDIDGELNTINQTSINVADKTINLAYPESGSNVDSVVDGVTNDMAGIVVYGKPTAPAFSNAPNPSDPLDMTERYYEKSLRWNNGTAGIDALGKPNGIDYATSALNESFWQLRGGHLQLTLPQVNDSNVVRDTSFGFRINERGELELFKRHWENGAYKARRLVRWGHGNGLL